MIKWRVTCDGEDFILTDEQYKNLVADEKRGIKTVYFNDFSIKPAFISKTRKVEYVDPSKLIAAPDEDYNFLSDEQIERNKKKIAEIKQRLAEKSSWPDVSHATA